MPKFLEDKLKKQYGEKSDVPYKIMNKMGVMKGNQITSKGKAMEEKHNSHSRRKKKQRQEAEKAVLGD